MGMRLSVVKARAQTRVGGMRAECRAGEPQGRRGGTGRGWAGSEQREVWAVEHKENNAMSTGKYDKGKQLWALYTPMMRWIEEKQVSLMKHGRWSTTNRETHIHMQTETTRRENTGHRGREKQGNTQGSSQDHDNNCKFCPSSLAIATGLMVEVNYNVITFLLHNAPCALEPASQH